MVSPQLVFGLQIAGIVPAVIGGFYLANLIAPSSWLAKNRCLHPNGNPRGDTRNRPVCVTQIVFWCTTPAHRHRDCRLVRCSGARAIQRPHARTWVGVWHAGNDAHHHRCPVDADRHHHKRGARCTELARHQDYRMRYRRDWDTWRPAACALCSLSPLCGTCRVIFLLLGDGGDDDSSILRLTLYRATS